MRHILAATSLAAALGATVAVAQEAPATPPVAEAPAQATTPLPTITAPEGYAEAQVMFTTDNLQGASVYDASGADIGEVHGLVFANGTNSFAAADPMPGDQSATKPASSDTMGGPAPATTPLDSSIGDTATAPMTESESQNPASGTETGDADRVQSTPSATSPAAPATPDAAASVGEGSATAITHAVIDVGGFLGMGEHRVAVPVDDLKVYSKDSDLRIYLPWSRDQLMALPAFDENAVQPG